MKLSVSSFIEAFKKLNKEAEFLMKSNDHQKLSENIAEESNKMQHFIHKIKENEDNLYQVLKPLITGVFDMSINYGELLATK